MHNLSMAYHAAGRDDDAVKLQEEIAKLGEEMGMTTEDQYGQSGSGAAGAEGAIKLTRQRGNQPRSPKKKTESGATWKPRRRKK